MAHLLCKILEEGGNINGEELPVIAADFPNLHLVIKWGYSPRSCHFAKDVSQAIEAKVSAEDSDYVREVYISVESMDKLRSIFGLPNF